MLDETDYPSFAIAGDRTSRVEITTVTISPAEIDTASALRITVREAHKTFPKVSATLRYSTPLRRGEIIHASFLMRTVESARESGEGTVQFELEDAATAAISGQFLASAVGQWREFHVPLRLIRECPSGRATINFRVGDQPQTIEISGLRIIRPEPPLADMATLPATPVQSGYEGSEPDASWRAAAQERILRYRRSLLSITVVDAAGDPISDAQVHIRQQQHSYRFGAAVRAEAIVDDAPRGVRYREAILRHFNAVTFENDLKWKNWIRDSATPLQAAHWCRDNGITLRGHTIIWPTNRRLPDHFVSHASDPDILRQILDDHITDIAARTTPLVAVWDVVNEPFRNRDFMDILGDDVLADWFRTARRAAPDARLYLNDYGIVTGGGMDTRHQAYYEDTVRRLIAADAPLDGLGFQGHFDRVLTPPARALDILDRFARLGREIEMTEYSTQIEDTDLAAAYLRDMLTLFYSHPATAGFILWSFTPGSGFRNTTWLQDDDGNLGPAGHVWHDLIYNQWWTDTLLITGSDGIATSPAFHGRHLVTVRVGSRLAAANVDLPPEGADVRIVIPPSVASQTPVLGATSDR